MPHGILCCLYLNLPMCFRVRSRSHVSLSQSYVTTFNNSFQPLPIFCHKKLHLRCCIGLELNLVTSAKILKSIGSIFPLPMIKCNLGKIWKTHCPRYPKTTFPDVFHIKCFAFDINGLNGVRLSCRNLVKDIQPFDFIKRNIIQQLAYETKYISQINGGLIMFFGILE